MLESICILICIFPPPRPRHAYTAAGAASWDSHPSEDLSELPTDRSIIMYGGSRGDSLPGVLGKVGPARYLMSPSFMAILPQVVLAQSFPSLVPPGTYVYADIHFSRCCRALSTPLRAKSRRILSMISRSSQISVLASRSSSSCCLGVKYLFLKR